jgi:hypothetical protein
MRIKWRLFPSHGKLADATPLTIPIISFGLGPGLLGWAKRALDQGIKGDFKHLVEIVMRIQMRC